MSTADEAAPPCVTAVLPTYNRLRVVGAALDSVLKQPFEDLEVLVVDDASAPHQRPDPEQFDDPRVRLIQRDRNGGVSAAQNAGLSQARGRFVAFLHSDDEWLPEKLETQVPLLDHAEYAVAAVEGSTVRRFPGGERVVRPRLAGHTPDDLFARRVTNLHIAGFLFRTDALRDIGGFDEQLRAYEDLDLLIRLWRAWRITTADSPVAVVDQTGTDRLAASPWMMRGREHLLDKYATELDTHGGLPAGWRDWSLQVALAAIDRGDLIAARHHLYRSMSSHRRHRVRRAPLLASTYVGAPVARGVARVYRRGAGLPASRRPISDGE